MKKMHNACRIGTSGWIYKHWRDIFYPAGLAQSHWFQHYANEFDTVEINNTFYRLPSESACDHWREQAPAGFKYAVKASRYITHVRRLHDCAEALETFLSRARRLEDHLGPILFQLPPRWQPDVQRFQAFAGLLPHDLLHVFEFRDPRWLIEPIRDVLVRYRLSFCIFDMPGVECPHWVTGPLVYLRFHGSNALYAGRYTREELANWAKEIRQFLKDNHDVYAFFNNDIGGNAIINARELIEMAR